MKISGEIEPCPLPVHTSSEVSNYLRNSERPERKRKMPSRFIEADRGVKGTGTKKVKRIVVRTPAR